MVYSDAGKLHGFVAHTRVRDHGMLRLSSDAACLSCWWERTAAIPRVSIIGSQVGLQTPHRAHGERDQLATCMRHKA
ncbi:hypothetical protein ASC93_00695 [Massilia sp. Root335]|nr:hypothetical protein ASC93_00695 [Massilia sp. Root335]